MRMGAAILSIVGCCAAAVLAVGCGRGTSAPAPPRHVIVIVSDALRADHLGAWGYERDTSPFIDQLAREGTLFERALSNSSFTCESVSSLFTGKFPSSTPWGSGWEARPDPALQGLGTLFREAGYVTALFSNTPMLDHPQFYRGFDETACFTEYGISRIAPRLVERALSFTRKRAAERTCMYLHFIDPHAPYDPPEDCYRRFADTVYPAPLNLTEDVRPNVPALVGEGFGPGEARYEDLVTRYDGEIAYIDDHVRKLFEGLRELGTLEDTLVVFTSDHGEEFLEHGFVEHAWQLYPESLHVPLIFWRPGQVPAARVADCVSLVDVLPSALRLAGVETDRADFDGAPLFEQGRGGWRVTPHDRPIISEVLIQTRMLARSVVQDGRQYLAWWKRLSIAEASEAARNQRALREALRSGAMQPLDTMGPAVADEELWWLDGGLRGTRGTGPETEAAMAGMRAVLEAYLARCPAPLPDGAKTTGDLTGVDPALRERLESLGYTGAPPADAPAAEDRERLEGLGYL